MVSNAVTVFGGSGFLGRRIVEHLAATGHDVRVGVRHPDRASFLRRLDADGRIELVHADVWDEATVARAVDGAASVINTVGHYVEKRGATFDRIHGRGALHVARQAKQAGAERLNALVLLRAAAEADGLKITARGNLTRETVSAMRAAMDWPGLLFEEKWRAGKQLREGHVEELRLVRELALMDGLLIRKDGKLRVGAAGRWALKGRRERLQANFFRNCFWRVSLDLFGEPECGSWPQQQIGPALWSLATTGDRWQDTQTLMRLSVLPDEAVLRNPDWVAPALFVLRVLRPLRWFGLVESRDEDATRRGRGMWRKTPLFDRFLAFDPGVVRIGEGPVH